MKPRLRGVVHQYAFVASLPPGLFLVASAPTALARVAAVFCAASSSAMFGVSALYHRITWAARQRLRMARLDHATIYVLIASTYTPYVLLELGGARQAFVLATIWAGAIAATMLKVLWFATPKALDAAMAVALGLSGAVLVPDLMHSVALPGIGLAVAGGVLYITGAVVYALRRPDPAPAVFGYHEIFHTLVTAGVACQFCAIAFFVIPAA